MWPFITVTNLYIQSSFSNLFMFIYVTETKWTSFHCIPFVRARTVTLICDIVVFRHVLIHKTINCRDSPRKFGEQRWQVLRFISIFMENWGENGGCASVSLNLWLLYQFSIMHWLIFTPDTAALIYYCEANARCDQSIDRLLSSIRHILMLLICSY